MSNPIYFRVLDIFRAIAVIAVIIYHYNPVWLPSGYLGVDLFFILSGFVITKSIFDSISDEKFSLVSFYVRRIKRILPLVMVVTLTILVLSFLLPLRQSIEATTNDSIAASLSYANIWFPMNSGNYWGNNANESPFLHFWSLSVEEQYYLFYPLIVVCTLKNINKLTIVLFSVIFLSLTLYLFLSFYSYNEWAFFLMPSRAWQLSSGALMFCLIKSNKNVEIPPIIGYAALTISLLCLTIPNSHNSSFFPVFFTISSTISLIFCVLAFPNLEEKKWKFLCNIGRISFSIYLWHWVVLKFFSGSTNSSAYSLLVYLVLTLTLSLLSYHFIESPFRYGKHQPRTILLSLVLTVMISLLIKSHGSFVYNTGIRRTFNDLKYDISPKELQGNDKMSKELLKNLVHEPKPKTNTTLHSKIGGLQIHKSNSDRSVLILGDSHGSMWCDALKVRAQEQNFSLHSFCANNLSPYFQIPINEKNLRVHYDFTEKQMLIFSETVKKTIQIGNYSTIIIASKWSRDFNINKISHFCEFCSSYSNVVILGEIPSLAIGNSNAVSEAYYKGTMINNNYYLPQGNEVARNLRNDKLHEITKSHGGNFFIPKINTHNHKVMVIKDKTPIYFDDDHLCSEGASIYVNDIPLLFE